MDALVQCNSLVAIASTGHVTWHNQTVPLVYVNRFVDRHKARVAKYLNGDHPTSQFPAAVRNVSNSRRLQDVIGVGHGVLEQLPHVPPLQLHHVHCIGEGQGRHKLVVG